ncbi:uncharacterized protein [Antedon mediterranea]|uniref:uncharacterized protein n=1 Tax=Antedon mediterranea TaxID=105859 RepID=UPI003AF82985
MEIERFCTTSSALHSADTDEIDKILHNLVQDTHIQIQQLEKENQQITALESRVKSTEEKIVDLEQANTILDEDTKAVHYQYRQNKDTIDSLKNHYTVLVEHQDALSQRYQTLQENWIEQKIGLDKLQDQV